MTTSNVRLPLRGLTGTRRAAGALASVALIAVAALVTVEFVVPSRLETALGGLAGAVAGFANWHPLAFGLVVFMVLAEVSRYWYRWLRGGVVPAAASTVPFRAG